MIARTADAESANHDLYATANPLDSIKEGAINQGVEGDCYFLSALAATAKNDPQAIADAIKDNHDGTYTVTFPGAKDTPVTVKAPTAMEMAIFNSPGNNNGVWATVMEKAFGQLAIDHPKSVLALSASSDVLAAVNSNDPEFAQKTKAQISQDLTPDQNSGPQPMEDRELSLANIYGMLPSSIYSGDLPQDYIAGGGSNQDALKLLTGKDVASAGVYYSGSESSPPLSELSDKGITSQVVANLLETAFLSNPPQEVTVGTSDAPGLPPELQANHSYTVVGYQPNGNGGGTVLLRNPYGTEPRPAYDGNPFVTVSVDQIMKYFVGVSATQAGTTFHPGSKDRPYPGGDA